MTAVAESPQKSEQHPRKAPKIRAVLAGGLVLGIGAAVTLAAWNDSEFAQGTFTAGAFGLQGSTNGTVFTENSVASAPATLAFTARPENLSPGDVVEAPYAVRLTSASTTGAIVRVSTETSTGSLAGLTYTLTQTEAFGCGEPVANALVDATPPQALGTTPEGVTFSLENGINSAAGDPIYLCFRITADDALVQSQTGTTTWKFAAQSQ